MYRLVIVSGPNRGSSFTLIEGKNLIGRQMDNHIVLTSSKVSKLHCILYATRDSVDLLDETSTNGTFVNGALVKKQNLQPGDKLGVGDFVMELVKVGALSTIGSPSVKHSSGNTHPNINGNLALAMNPVSLSDPHHSFQPLATAGAVEAPDDPVEKVKFLFEGKFMPSFYGQMMKNEYRVIVSVLIAFLVLVSVVGSVMPAMDIATKAIQQEGEARAKTLAREVADRYLPAIASHNTSQIDLSVLENDENVRMVTIVNLEMQIIAPQSRLGQILAGGKEASFAMYMAKKIKAGDERPGSIVGETVAIAIEPLKTVDPRQLKSQIAGLAIVSIDFSRNQIELGGMAVAYSMALVIAGIAGMLVYLILMRMTLKPFEVLNDDLDQVLRGDLSKVTHEFKISELNNLWDNINSALMRNTKGSSHSMMGVGEVEVNWEHELATVRALTESSGSAYIAFDHESRVVGLNSLLDEVLGIRMDSLGQPLQQVARDMAFVALVNDLKERTTGSPSRSAIEESEFSGVQYQVVGVGVGAETRPGLVLVFKRKG